LRCSSAAFWARFAGRLRGRGSGFHRFGRLSQALPQCRHQVDDVAGWRDWDFVVDFLALHLGVEHRP
jgi:hypothetical protein